MTLQSKNNLNCLFEASNIDRKQIVEKVRQWGGQASDAVLDSACEIFSIKDIDGIIAYKIEYGCAIVYGDPICSPDDLSQLAKAFHSYCEEHNLYVIYILASEKFSKWSIENIGGVIFGAEEELFLNPQDDITKGAQGSLVRRKVRHALKENTIAKELLDTDSSLKKDIQEVGTAWLKTRKGPQVYISHVHLFEDSFGKRFFYAQKEGEVVGVLILNQLQAYNGWLLNHLMIKPNASHGTPELLVMTAIETLRSEGCSFVTFGSIPREQLGEIYGLGFFSKSLSRLIFRMVKWVLRLNGHRKFWGKFNPRTAPTYVIFSRGLSIRAMRALIRALNVSF